MRLAKRGVGANRPPSRAAKLCAPGGTSPTWGHAQAPNARPSFVRPTPSTPNAVTTKSCPDLVAKHRSDGSSHPNARARPIALRQAASTARATLPAPCRPRRQPASPDPSADPPLGCFAKSAGDRLGKTTTPTNPNPHPRFATKAEAVGRASETKRSCWVWRSTSEHPGWLFGMFGFGYNLNCR